MVDDENNERIFFPRVHARARSSHWPPIWMPKYDFDPSSKELFHDISRALEHEFSGTVVGVRSSNPIIYFMQSDGSISFFDVHILHYVPGNSNSICRIEMNTPGRDELVDFSYKLAESWGLNLTSISCGGLNIVLHIMGDEALLFASWLRPFLLARAAGSEIPPAPFQLWGETNDLTTMYKFWSYRARTCYCNFRKGQNGS